MSNQNIIHIENGTKKFKVGDGMFTALSNINLMLKKGEFSGLVGPSGSGKTTLLNMLGALDVLTEGHVEIGGQRLDKFTDRQSAQLRNKHIGFVFQSYNLLPIYSLYENVEFPLLLQNHTEEERKNMVMQALEWVGLSDKAQKKPSEISGGEAQRVAIARAIVKTPGIVLADEPTANLDSDNAHGIMKIMKKLNEDLGITFLFASHDEKVMQYLERIIYLEDGKIVNDEKIK